MSFTQREIHATEYRRCSSHSAGSCLSYDQPIKFTDYILLKAVGIFGTISSSSFDNEKSKALTLTVVLPWLLWSRAITVQLLLKSLSSPMFTSQLSQGLSSVKNVVPDKSRVMVACEQGDVPAVQYLFQTKRASPHDITRAGRTPLLVNF